MAGINAGPHDHLLSQETLCKKLSFLHSVKNWIMFIRSEAPAHRQWLEWAAKRIPELEQKVHE